MAKMLTEAYRPYLLDDIIGQDRAKKLVRSWLRQDRVPRSVLICGEFSSGKTTIARIIARSVLCKTPKEGNACGECASCKAFDKGNHPDFNELNAASDRGIGDMRELTKKVKIRPMTGKKKVVILDEAHGITKQGWEAVLKPLEEPPEHLVFLILTTNPEKIPKTIISRCSKIPLAAVTVEECTELLTQVATEQGLGKADITKDHLLRLTKATGAHPRNALHALEQVYTLVLDSKESGQAVDAALVNGFIQDVAVHDAETVAAGIVRQVLLGRPGSALAISQDNIGEADQVLSRATEMLRQAMLFSVSRKLLDPYYADLLEPLPIFTLTPGKAPAHLEAREAVLEAYAVFTNLRIKTSTYMVPVGEVIGEAVARAALLIQKLLKAHEMFGAEKTKNSD